MNKQKGESQNRSLVKFFWFYISSDKMGASDTGIMQLMVSHKTILLVTKF